MYMYMIGLAFHKSIHHEMLTYMYYCEIFLPQKFPTIIYNMMRTVSIVIFQELHNVYIYI